ncbi:MAG TPA: FecR family protein [Steroidobacteraceae bacterium]|nr:FecR family protein [Steroidobacteraceae bacterium]
MKTTALSLAFGLSLMASVLAAGRACADADDPPSRVARIAYAEGSVSFQPAGTQDWVTAPLNRPLTTGDTLWSDQQSRVELDLDGSVIRLSSSSELSFVNLGNEVTQIQLTGGTLLLRVRRLDDNETYEVDTPNLAFSVLRPGTYRISIDPSGNSTVISARSGQGEVSGGGSAYSLYAGDSVVFSGTDQLAADADPNAGAQDSFDSWSADRDRRWDRSDSARYVSPDVVGYQDLDEHGTWRTTPEYGPVWYPRGVAPDWAPYHDGHWSYIAPWGYTWVDDQPWGFAPFHYGRWVRTQDAWGWVPSPPRPDRGAYVRPVYAPALVAWVAAGAGIAWFALGPREVFVPSYPVSPTYVRDVNVSNTTVNTTTITNVYNTTVINNKTVNVTYVNRAVPGAIAATSAQSFSTAQPVARNLIKVDQREMGAEPVRALAPAVVPTKQAVLGAARPAPAKPPAAVQTRAVVARTAPPPPPVTFERREQAIKNNGGKPLSISQVRQIQPAAAAPRAAAIRIAPPAAPVSVSKSPAPRAPAAPPAVPPAAKAPPALPAPAAPPAAKTPPPPPAAPPAVLPAAKTPAAPSQPAPAAVHPRELPTVPKPASPSEANSALEREHLQQQQQLRAQQEQDRLRVQREQDLEHQRLAKQQADAAKDQELERQHAQQTQQLQQKHIQEQQQMQAKQQEQIKAAAKPVEKAKRPGEGH